MTMRDAQNDDKSGPQKATKSGAQEIAENAPLALLSLREQMRPGLADAVNEVTTIESREQKWLQQTNDHKEGVKAVAEKRAGNFTNS